LIKFHFKPIVIPLLILLAIAQVYLLNSLSTYGSRLSKLEKDINDVAKSNDALEESIASASSVTALSIKAKTLGLTVSPPYLSFQNTAPVALNFPSGN